MKNSNFDIDRSVPRALHFQMNKPDNQLKTDDLYKNKPQVTKFETRRNTNPMLPVYNLPKVTFKPCTPTKFVRNTLDISDLEKASPCHQKLVRSVIKNSLDVNDVPGA